LTDRRYYFSLFSFSIYFLGHLKGKLVSKVKHNNKHGNLYLIMGKVTGTLLSLRGGPWHNTIRLAMGEADLILVKKKKMLHFPLF
jgi:hypothetical protein